VIHLKQQDDGCWKEALDASFGGRKYLPLEIIEGVGRELQ